MLRIQNIGSVSVIKARSSLVGDCLQQCHQGLDDCLLRRRTNLVLDLAESPILASEGLEFIVDAQQKCLSRGGKLVVVDPQPLCREVLEITGVDAYVSVFNELRDALSEFAR